MSIGGPRRPSPTQPNVPSPGYGSSYGPQPATPQPIDLGPSVGVSSSGISSFSSSTPIGGYPTGDGYKKIYDIENETYVIQRTPEKGISIPLIAVPAAISTGMELLPGVGSYVVENPVAAAQTGLTAYSYVKNPKKLLSDFGVPDLTKYIPQSKPSYDPFQGVVNNQNAPDQTAVFVSNQSKAGALLIFGAVAGITFLMLKKKGK